MGKHGQAITGSPVRPPHDLDAALIYDPPWARRARTRANTKTPPVESPPTSPELEDVEPTFVGDRAMLALQRQLSLNPDIVPEPPPIHRGPPIEKMAVRLCIVVAVAALGVWAAMSLTAKPANEDSAQSAPAPVPIITVATPVPVRTALPSPPTAMESLPAPPGRSTMRNGFQSGPQMTLPPPQQPDVPEEQANRSELSPDEIAMLLKRGKADLMDGDISSARLLLRRAAEAGNAEAALALGSTFDPVVITRLGALGVQTDPAKAREWYQKAAALGSTAAARLLARSARAGE